MTSTVPAIIAWPLIAVMTLLLIARYLLGNSSLYDTYYTNLMAFLLLAQLLRERSVEELLARKIPILTVTTSQQLGFAAMIFAATEFIGFTMMWSRHSPQKTRRDHRRYRVAAIALCTAYLLAATRARVAGLTLEVCGGWDSILAFCLYLTMVFIAGMREVWMFAAELEKTTRTRESLVAAGGLLLGLSTAVSCAEALVFAVTDQLSWTHLVSFELWLHGFEFFCVAVAVYVLGAVPLAMKLVSYFALDTTSRNWRALQPLRRDMVAAAPESVFGVEHDNHRFRKTSLQLHQTVIETRDAMLQLRPYVREIAPHDLAQFFMAYSVPNGEHDAAADALGLARACQAKNAGATPEPHNAAIRTSRATTLADETSELLRVAKWWPAATTGQSTQSVKATA
jgi:hypothetical protein